MPDPIVRGRIGLYLSMFWYGLTSVDEFAVEHAAFFRTMAARMGGVRGKRVIDVGCGKMYWLTLLLATEGADALGVDTEVSAHGFSFGKYVRLLRTNGVERMLRTLVWDVLFARRYYRMLERAHGRPLQFGAVRTTAYDGVHLPAGDASVDWVVSHEVFEHVADLDALLQDVRRVLRPGGRTYIYVHHHTSLSGGHHIAWKHPDARPSKVVPPWDQLRERRYVDIPSWLNELRADDYRRAFERVLEIEEWIWLPKEGEALLTPEIRRELSDYSEQELLHKGFIVVARRPEEHA